MNIDGLKYFVTVAECGSFSKAAERLYITQPALSRHIQRLEEELGAPLLQRSRKDGVVPTELGALCLQDARQLLTHAERIRSRAISKQNGTCGTIVIGYNGMEGELLYSLTDHLRRKCPDMKVVLHHESIGDLLHCTLNGTTDISFLHKGPKYPNAEALRFLPLRDSRMKLMVPESHPLASRQHIRVEELEHEPIIGWQRSMFPEFYDAFHRLCQQRGFSPKTICEEETYAVFSYIGAGDGIGYILSGSENMFVPQPIRTIDIELEDGKYMPNWPLSLAWNVNNTNPCIQPVLNIAAQYLRAQE